MTGDKDAMVQLDRVARAEIYAHAVIAAAAAYGDDPVGAMTSPEHRGRRALPPAVCALALELGVSRSKLCEVFGLVPNSVRVSHDRLARSFERALEGARGAVRVALVGVTRGALRRETEAEVPEGIAEGVCEACGDFNLLTPAGRCLTCSTPQRAADAARCGGCRDLEPLNDAGLCVGCAAAVLGGGAAVAEVAAAGMAVPRPAAEACVVVTAPDSKPDRMFHSTPAARTVSEPDIRLPAVGPIFRPPQPDRGAALAARKTLPPAAVTTSPLEAQVLEALAERPMTSASLASRLDGPKESAVIACLSQLERDGRVSSAPAPENASRRYLWSVIAVGVADE